MQSQKLSLWLQGLQDDEDSDDLEPEKKRKKPSELLSRCQEKEEEVEAIYSELRSKHNDYTVPQLKLWARMIQCGTHDDYEDPPHVPMIIRIPPKRQRKDSIAEAITGAAEAVAKAFTPTPQPLPGSQLPQVIQWPQVWEGNGISLGKAANLQMKNFQQLRYKQQLYEENILSEKELTEQKAIILDPLRKLA